MENVKKDLRVKRSEAAIAQAFREMALEHVQMKDITVKALCERAGINRKTFYLHYHSIEELVEALRQDFIRDLSAYMGDTIKNKNA